MIEKLMKQVFTGGHTSYKDFLYHVNKDKPSNGNILKIKEPRRKIKVLDYNNPKFLRHFKLKEKWMKIIKMLLSQV